MLRFMLSSLLTMSAMVFLLVNVPVVRDVAKSKLPLVLGTVAFMELTALVFCVVFFCRNNILDWFRKQSTGNLDSMRLDRLTVQDRLTVLALTVFSMWATLKFPIWTRWGFIERFGQLHGIGNIADYREPFYQLGVVLAVLCLPFLFFSWRWLYCRLKPGVIVFFRGFAPTEWLYFGGFWLVGTAALLYACAQTSLFTYPIPVPEATNQTQDFPMGILVSDSALLINGDTFCNNTSSANDIRQPLFAIIGTPFAMAAHAMAWLVWKILLPGVQYKLIYAAAIAFWQIGCFAAVGIMIRRLIAMFTSTIFSWSVLAMYTVAWSTIVFSITVEQYAFSLMMLVTLVYYYIVVREPADDVSRQQDQGTFDTLCFGAIGSILTSVVPVVFFLFTGALTGTSDRGMKSGRFARAFVHLIIVWFFLAVFLGKFGLLFNLTDRIHNLSGYADVDSTQVGTEGKLTQYGHFLYACVLEPAVESQQGILVQTQPGNVIMYTAAGMFVLGTLGFICFYNRRFVQIAFVWLLFSFVLMGVLGWGCRENGMILYTSYFSWAIIPLVLLPVYRLTFNDTCRIGSLVITVAAVYIGLCNFCSVNKITQQAVDWLVNVPK